MTRETGFLSGNALKVIAAFAMTADHVGLLFFPEAELFRIVGRLAYPIFAFMIAQGCKYTHSRLRYFLGIFLLAALCQTVYYVVDRDLYMSILVTFSCSIPAIYALQWMQREPWKGGAAFVLAVAGIWVLNRVLTIDYGFWGCMTPVLAAAFQPRAGEGEPWLRKLDRNFVHVGMLTLGLLLLARDVGGNQIWSLLSVPLLLCYNGKRGRWRMKYFFYIFYPLHLALLQGIYWLVS